MRCRSNSARGTRPGNPKPNEPDLTWLHRVERQCAASGGRWAESPQRPALQAQLDFRFPAEWYGAARARGPRTLHCHVGPTNSGKTHAAIRRLCEAPRGVYCAPLRLLAMEMWERLNGPLNRPCGLRTGEVSSGPSSDPSADPRSVATLSCTVEMLDLSQEFDVAVIDEIQLVSDEQRGWAFTQALLGVNARQVYLCGEEAALPLIQKIAHETGDQVVVHRYERLSPLLISERSLAGRLESLRPGDCVVAFSRKKIFETKYLIESRTGQKCAVVYGNLPMENRSLQARAFNERQDGYQVMVASDAIGMGINL